MSNDDAHRPFAIVINGEKIIDHDRSKRLTGLQRRFLDQMDQKMDGGIRLGGEQIDDPDPMQRAQFVANTLMTALDDDNEALAAACCSYLARRLPKLQQVRARKTDDGPTMIELVFDRSYEQASIEKPVQFTKKPT